MMKPYHFEGDNQEIWNNLEAFKLNEAEAVLIQWSNKEEHRKQLSSICSDALSQPRSIERALVYYKFSMLLDRELKIPNYFDQEELSEIAKYAIIKNKQPIFNKIILRMFENKNKPCERFTSLFFCKTPKADAKIDQYYAFLAAFVNDKTSPTTTFTMVETFLNSIEKNPSYGNAVPQLRKRLKADNAIRELVIADPAVQEPKRAPTP